jgi:hypothetical protein
MSILDTIENANRELAAATAELRRQHHERLAAALVGQIIHRDGGGIDGVIVSVRRDEVGMYAVAQTPGGSMFWVGC